MEILILQQNPKLKPQEIDLINLIRTKYRFGTIEILVRDGIPQDILKTVERTRLGEIDRAYPQIELTVMK
jgi:hypothetical protein